MRRLVNQIAALCAVAFLTTGCASLGLFGDSSTPAPDKTAADTGSADGSYDALIKKQPHSLDGEIRKAQLLRASRDYQGAIHILAQLMLIAPDDPRIVGEYGKVLAQEGRTADAQAFLKRAIELQPDNWSFYSALGVTYDQLQQRDDAEAAYRHALQLKPSDPGVLNNYAMSQMMEGHLAHAEQLLHEAAAHGGDYPKIAANLKMIADMRDSQGRAGGPQSAVKPAPATAITSSTRMPSIRAANKAPAKTISVAKIAAPHRLPPPSKVKAKPTPKPQVVMEKVPYDPLAGKVYGHHSGKEPLHVAAKKPVEEHAKTQRVAEVEGGQSAKPAPAKPHNIPALRTAADLY